MHSSFRRPVVVPAAPEEVRRSGNALLWTGILAIVAGILAIAIPPVASLSVTILLGLLLLIAGVAWFVSALSARAEDRRWGLAVLAALMAVAGLWMVVRPWEATITMTAILVAYFIATGVIRVATAAVGPPRRERVLLGISGALAVLVGILIGSELPSSASWAIGLLVGIQFLFDGGLLVVLALTLRRSVDANERVAAAPEAWGAAGGGGAA